MAVAEVQRYRTQLERATPDVDPDTVSAALALQIGYDVALLRLAELIGIDSDPSRFDRPQLERTRLEDAFAERGISLESERREFGRVPRRVGPPDRAVRCRWRPSACPEPTRSLSRAAKVAAWVRRSIPSLANRFET